MASRLSATCSQTFGSHRILIALSIRYVFNLPSTRSTDTRLLYRRFHSLGRENGSSRLASEPAFAKAGVRDRLP